MLTKTNSYKPEAKDGILVGRAAGKNLLDQLMGIIAASPAGSVIPLNFEKIRFIDFSSADEFLGKLVSRLLSGEFRDIYVCLEKMTPEVEETLDAALKLRGQNAVVLGADGAAKILGKINPVLKDTFDLINDLKELSARGLADKKGIAINASSNRLTKLQGLGLIARAGTSSGKGAEQYVYRTLVV